MRSRSKPFSSRILRAETCWPIVFWAFSGCWIPPEVQLEITNIRSVLEGLKNTSESQESRLGHIEDYLTYCPDEVQKLVGRVEKECEASSNETCMLSEADIRIEVRKVAPWQGGKFLPLMQDRKHVAFYLTVDGRVLNEAEKKQLRDLVQPAWLDDGARKTRFLVISYSTDNSPESLRQASRRGKHIIQEIKGIAEKMGKLQTTAAAPAPTAVEGQAVPASVAVPVPPPSAAAQGMPDTSKSAEVSTNMEGAAPIPAVKPPSLPRYILHWALPFPRSGEQLKPEDRPRQSGDKITNSVFVYRVDC